MISVTNILAHKKVSQQSEFKVQDLAVQAPLRIMHKQKKHSPESLESS